MEPISAHKKNCFDTIRHIAALTVIFSHHHPFNGMGEYMFRGFLSWGGVGVAVFFSISGFLVTPSFYRSKDFISFMEKRVRRIFPGLIACSFVLIYIVAPFYCEESKLDYILSRGAFRDFISMSTMLPIHINNLFEGYKFNGPPDGSLWTLPIEFSCYLIISFALSLSKTAKTSAILFAASVISSIALSDSIKQGAFYSITLFWLLQFGSCFFLGSLLSLTRESWDNKKTKIFLCITSILFLYILNNTKEIIVFGYICITLLTVIIGTSFKDKIIKGRFDISYGLYIYAWPVQQIISNETGLSFWSSLACSILVTATLATASWVYIEKPFITRKNKTMDSVASLEKPQQI